MNKKGLLLAEETLKMVIAVIAIMFLVILLVNVYFNRIDAKNLEKARNILVESKQSIQNISKSLAPGESNDNFLLYTPIGWALYSFTGSGIKPQACGGINCLCICDDTVNFIGSLREERVEQCDDVGACARIEGLKDYSEDFEIDIVEGEEGEPIVQLKISKDENRGVTVVKK